MANCGKKIFQLNRHMVAVHGVSAHMFDMALAIKTKAADANNYLVCPICSFATTRLDRHLKNYHKYVGMLEEDGKEIVKRAKRVRSNVTIVKCYIYVTFDKNVICYIVSFDLSAP